MFICFTARDNVKKITITVWCYKSEEMRLYDFALNKGIEEMKHPHFLMLYMKHISQGGTNT